MVNKYQGSTQEFDVICEPNTSITMRDGVRLSTDIYFPAFHGTKAKGRFPVILERTPYDNSSPSAVTNAKYFARRGYITAIQDVRGRFESEGEWYAFAKEAPDGFDTIEWLGIQSWSNGLVGTMGSSYSGSNQSASATLNPPHLSTMIVGVGASNYYHSSMRHNGAAEQRFQVYAFRMAVTSKEASVNPALKAALIDAFENQMPNIVQNLPLRKGSTALSSLPSYEQWALDIVQNTNYDDYWKQRGYAISEYYQEHSDIPSLYLGGWYDSYARNTCESFIKLRDIKDSPQKLLMGPWTHGGWEATYSGDVDFGTNSHINHNDLRLSWFDHYMKKLDTEVKYWPDIRIFTMGSEKVRPDDQHRIYRGGFWQNENDWPPDNTVPTQYYLQQDGGLSVNPPLGKDDSYTSYTYDPKNPVPTIGGGLSAADSIMPPGAYDQRGRLDLLGCTDTQPLNTRGDVLTFQTPSLDNPVEVTGPISIHLWAASSEIDTDFTAKLIDVVPPSDAYPDGLAINLSDSIIRGRYRNNWSTPEPMIPGKSYELIFELYPTSNIFNAGHKIRLDISSSNWPRFDANPNTFSSNQIDRSYRSAKQTVYHDMEHPSFIELHVRSS
ncbi:MAG: CocE/NonD family hydrolase [Chloroflexota bacterium]|nr:CocE/NonD family hydrolase [Chloroflexota bacterium]